MSPAGVLVEQLAAARGAGAMFETAWPDALGTALQAADPAEHAEWARVLGGMSDTWRRGFERQAFGRRELSLYAVAVDPDREPLPDRPCARCGQEIPDNRRKGPPARYCGDDCRREAHRERWQASRAA